MRCAIGLALLLLVAPVVYSQQPTLPEIARRAKAATALVEVAGGFKHGSAFCIHDSGIYLSNEHVVRGAAEVKFILHPGLKQQQIVRARVVRTDRELDLALLRVLDPAMHSVLPIGSSDDLAELTDVIAVGFPFGKALAEKDEYPAVSVNQGRITALRLKKGALERIHGCRRQVPTDANTGDVDVVVAITDASRQEVFHTFRVAVR